MSLMVRLPLTQTTPLVQEADGTIRVSGSRVTLDTLVQAFHMGATADQIQDSFPSLSLREIYGAIAYYLQRSADVKAYLARRRDESVALRAGLDVRQDIAGLRARVRGCRGQLADF